SSNSSEPAPRRSWLSGLFSLTLLGLTVCGLRNVFAFEPELESLALEAACAPSAAAPVVARPVTAPAGHSGIAPDPAPPCHLQLRGWERNPLGRTFMYEGGRGLVRVQCWREYWALGDYRCKREL